VLTSDRRAAFEGLNAAFGTMARAPSYVGMLERAGLQQPSGRRGWLAEVLDTVAWGDEVGLHTRAQELKAAGADEVVFWPFPAGHDPPASVAATLDALQELAA